MESINWYLQGNKRVKKLLFLSTPHLREPLTQASFNRTLPNPIPQQQELF